MKLFFTFLRLALILAFFAGCVRAVPHVAPSKELDFFHPVDASEIQFADDLDFALLETAIYRSINYYENAGKDKVYRVAGRLVDAAKLKETLIAFNEVVRQCPSADELKKNIIADFDVYLATGAAADRKALFTGYYEPLLEGSFSPTDEYKYPLYRPPPDLLVRPTEDGGNIIGRMEGDEFIPYYSRAEIDMGGALRGKGLELIWVNDPVELFSLHIQGSGKVKLEDGTLITVTYAQNNGRPFRSATRFMLDEGKISGAEASYLNFKKFMKRKSDEEILKIFSHNERYIFFRFAEGEPVGSLGEPVTPDRSIATDPEFFPQGALAFIRLRKPAFDEQGNILRRIEFSRFVLSQDKGSAIKGPARVDLFCGFGEKARATAGSLKEKGYLYLLIKK
ncbi:MAG TPA: MltA domain-containing protein [Smithellaceae bacterium]|nr:MltA domain-containing protein [Smithellaceae bacterium]